MLVLDYGGTVTSVVKAATKDNLEQAMKESIVRLVSHPRISIAIISGRGLDDIYERVMNLMIFTPCGCIPIYGIQAYM